MKSGGEQIGIKLAHDKYVYGVGETRREVITGASGQVGDVWKDTRGPGTRLLSFSRNIGHNSVSIERNIFWEKRGIGTEPCGRKEHVCAKNCKNTCMS